MYDIARLYSEKKCFVDAVVLLARRFLGSDRFAVWEFVVVDAVVFALRWVHQRRGFQFDSANFKPWYGGTCTAS